MPSDDVIAYFVEYWDEQATLTRQFRLNSFKDGTLELLDLKTKRMFLKRIYCPEISRDRLFLGSVVNVFGRSLQVTAAADVGTTKYLERCTSTASALCLVEDLSALPAIVAALHGGFGSVRSLKTVFVGDLSPAAQDRLACGPDRVAVAIEVYDATTTECESRLREIVSGLRGVVAEACFGADSMVGPDVQNCAARLDAGECTLCLIKPHVVKDKLAGSMLECIFAAGFSIEGAQQMTLDADMAHQFYGAYKGVLARYEDIVGELAGGPLLALRISGPVAAFREFCGPTDVKLATALRPKSLRATFGKGVVHNAVHATDLDDDGAFECDFFFNVLSGGVA